MAYISSKFLGKYVTTSSDRDISETWDIYEVFYTFRPIQIYINEDYSIKNPGKIEINNENEIIGSFKYADPGGGQCVIVPEYYEIDFTQIGDYDLVRKWEAIPNSINKPSSQICETVMNPYYCNNVNLYYDANTGQRILIKNGETSSNYSEIYNITLDKDVLLSILDFLCESSNTSNSHLNYEMKINVNYSSDNAYTKTVYPIGQTLSEKNPITFNWEHVSERNTPSFGYDLQYSLDNSVWININSVEPDNNNTEVLNNYEVPAFTFKIGNVYWRIRTYNSLNIASDWALSAFIASSSPNPPIITNITTNPKPIITWESNEQEAFRIVAGDYDSNAIFGSQKTFEIPNYFNDGNMKIRLYIQNATGKWSEPAEEEITIKNQEGASIKLNAIVENNIVKLNWETQGPYISYYILRNGNPIFKTEKNNFSDIFSIGETTYTVLGSIEGGCYTLSNNEKVNFFPLNACLINACNLDVVNLSVKRNSEPEISENNSIEVNYNFFEGYKKPFASTSNFTNRSLRLSFTIFKN